MKVQIGSKVTISLPNGLRWPGVVISDESSTPTEVVNKATQAKVTISVTRADVITLRTTRENESYLALTSEVVQYGYRPIMEPRFSALVGLDATEDGEKIGLQALIEKHGASYSAWQAAAFEKRNGIVAADNL